jgi:hypothetical protein
MPIPTAEKPDNPMTWKSARLVLSVLFCLWSLSVTRAIQAEEAQEDWFYVTRPGDKLQEIGERFLAPGHEWFSLLKYNGLQDPFQLPPGTTLKIPVAWLQQSAQSATLAAVTHKVWIRRAHQQAFLRADVNDRVSVGDELRTADGTATLRFADGSETDVASHTRLILNRMTRFGSTGMMDTRVKLLEGSIENRVAPVQKPAGRYEVTTPGAVAAVRGTVFRLHADDLQTRVEVLEGSVELSNAGASTRLESGEGTTNAEGPIIRQDLPAAPVMQVGALIQQLPLTVSWTSVQSAEAYRISLYDEVTGNRLLEQTTVELALTLPPLKNGLYRLTVRAVAADLLEGPDAQSPFEVRQTAAPAALLKPDDGTTVDNVQPLFEWETGQPGLLSSLEISTQADFSTLLTRTGFAAVTAAHPEVQLPAGQYFWRVVTLAGGDEFSYTSPRQLSIVGKLRETRIISVNYTSDQVRVFWRQVSGAISYELQVAEDEFFHYVRNTLTLPDTNAILKLDAGKTWYVRVRAIGGPLTVSQFGEAEPVRIKTP